MITRTYKNGNITIRHESFFDGEMPNDFHHFPAWIAEHADGFDVYGELEFQCWGNDYGAYCMKAFVNGVLGYYNVTPDDYEQYTMGKTVRIKRESLAPMFTLPTFYKYADNVEWRGVKGSMYWMEQSIDCEQRDELEWGGASVLHSFCEYAPEITSTVVFVPNGTVFDFC
jgi:hypothetical protein